MVVLVICDYGGLLCESCIFMILEALISDLLAFNIKMCTI